MVFSLQIAVTLYFASPASAPAYFGQDFTRAIHEIHAYKQEISIACDKTGTDATLVAAMVFPEFIRYSYLSDFMETLVLEELYVGYGSHMADFSIEHCQIKPSFAEQVEHIVKNDQRFKRYAPLLADCHTGKGSRFRQERLNRLKKPEWQFLYAALFVKIAEEKFALRNLGRVEKLRMLATLYNRGLYTNASKLLLLSRTRSFPNGNRSHENPFAYSDIALLYLVHKIS